MGPSRLPVVPNDPPSKIRPSRRGKWRAASLVAVHLIIAAHIAWWLLAGRTVTPVEPSEAMAFAKGGMVNAGLIFFAAAILVTAVCGRWFCGWACHLVALQDLCRWLLLKAGIRPQPLRSRLLAWVPAAAFVYMFLWPLAYRAWIGDQPFAVRGTELTTAAFWETFPGWIVGILTFAVCGFATVYFLGAKGFCTYACPYGAIFGAVDRLAPLRIRVTDACNGCGHCTAVCSSNVRVHEEVRDFGMVVDSGCMKCTDCVSVCPNDALYYGAGPLPLFAKPRGTAPAAPAARPGLPWREELTLALAFGLAFFSFRGLYGRVPFLMSLGVAGVLAYLVLLATRLARRPDFAWRHGRLRAGGRLTPAGLGALAALAALALFWGHAATLRAQGYLAERDFRATAPRRAALLDVTAPAWSAAGAERQRIDRARERLARLERWGLAPWLGAAQQEAFLAYLAGDPAGFRSAAALARSRRETSWELAVLEARAAAERGDLEGCREAAERAIALAPGRPQPYAALGILLARAGRLDEAAAALARGIGRLPAAADLVYDAGVVAAMRGRTGEAIGFFGRAVELEPGHRMARENLAGMLASAGRYEESVTAYRQAVAAAPDDAALRVLLARALAGAGREQEARAELERAGAAIPAAAPTDPPGTR